MSTSHFFSAEVKDLLTVYTESSNGLYASSLGPIEGLLQGCYYPLARVGWDVESACFV